MRREPGRLPFEAQRRIPRACRAQGDDRGAARGDAEVERGGAAHMPPLPQQLDPAVARRRLLNDLARAIGRPVVDDEDLEVGDRLPEETVDGSADAILI